MNRDLLNIKEKLQNRFEHLCNANYHDSGRELKILYDYLLSNQFIKNQLEKLNEKSDEYLEILKSSENIVFNPQNEFEKQYMSYALVKKSIEIPRPYPQWEIIKKFNNKLRNLKTDESINYFNSNFVKTVIDFIKENVDDFFTTNDTFSNIEIKSNENKMNNTIVILTALPQELNALFSYLGSPFEKEIIKTDNRIYYKYRKSNGLQIICCSALDMGQLNISILAKDVINHWNPQKIILTGICGALTREIALGDIIVADQIVDYELAKLTDSNKSIRWNVFRTDGVLLNQFKNYRNDNWVHYINVERPDGNKNKIPKIHFGIFLSGNKIIASENEANSLKSIWHKSYAIEMEGTGIAAVLHQMPNPPSFIMVKSACDYADAYKNDNWQEYSANASAAFVTSFIFDNYNQKDLLKIDSQKYEENREIRFIISASYDLSELNTLAFDLGIDFEEISGKTKSEKITELLKYCNRRKIINKLIDLINKDRNNILKDYSG